MRCLLIIITALIFATQLASGQDGDYVDPNYHANKNRKPKRQFSLKDRIYFGGSLGLQFGSFTSVLIEPIVGVKVTEKFSTGIGVGYRYGRDNVIDIKYNNYLGRVFARYLFIPYLYGHVEYMVESYDKVFYFTGKSNYDQRTLVPFLFVGGGFRSEVGENSSFVIQVLFNVLNHPYSNQVYPSNIPYVSLGFIQGF